MPFHFRCSTLGSHKLQLAVDAPSDAQMDVMIAASTPCSVDCSLSGSAATGIDQLSFVVLGEQQYHEGGYSLEDDLTADSQPSSPPGAARVAVSAGLHDLPSKSTSEQPLDHGTASITTTCKRLPSLPTFACSSSDSCFAAESVISAKSSEVTAPPRRHSRRKRRFLLCVGLSVATVVATTVALTVTSSGGVQDANNVKQ